MLFYSRMKTFYQILYNRIAVSKVYFNSLPLDKHDFYSTLYSRPGTFVPIECNTAKFLLFLLIASANRSLDPNCLSIEIRRHLNSKHVQEFADPILDIYDKVAYKFNMLGSVYSNPFLERPAVNEFMATFYAAQKTYWILNRFVRKYKYKKTPAHIQHDLYLNPISVDDRNTIAILQDGTKYLFTVADILRIINTAITNSYFLEQAIQLAKNPYTNVPFSKADLYTFYLFISSRYVRVPELFYQFFRCDFCIHRFSIQNYQLLQDTYYENLKSNCSQQYLVSQSRNMFRKYNGLNSVSNNTRIIVDVDVPVETLIDIMMPYLKLFLKTIHHFNADVRYSSNRELEYRLRAFYLFNPVFGRKTINVSNPKKSRIDFNMRHIRFDKNAVPPIPFRISHLVNDFDIYENHYDTTLVQGTGTGTDTDTGTDSDTDTDTDTDTGSDVEIGMDYEQMEREEMETASMS